MRYRQLGAFGAIFFVAACSRPGSDDQAFRWTTELPAGAIVHFRDGAGNITVRRGNGPTVVVNGARQWRRGHANDVQFAVTQSGRDYYVCAMWRGSGKCGSTGYRGRSTGGFLTMFSLFHRSTDATADLTAEIPSNVVVDARTMTGSVDIDGTTAGVTARSTNGNVSAKNVSGPVSLTTTHGNIGLSIDSVADADSIRVSTTNGNIRAELPSTLQGNFDISTVNGMVHNNLPIALASKGKSTKHLQGQVGSLPRVVRLRAMNGVVSVIARGAPATQ